MNSKKRGTISLKAQNCARANVRYDHVILEETEKLCLVVTPGDHAPGITPNRNERNVLFQGGEEHDGHRAVKYAHTVQEGDKHWVCAKPRTTNESDDCNRTDCRKQNTQQRKATKPQ